jgi:hypothetical protein
LQMLTAEQQLAAACSSQMIWVFVFLTFYWRFLNWIGSEFQLEFIHVQFAWFHPLSNFLELSHLLWLSNVILGFIHYSTVLLNLKFIVCPMPWVHPFVSLS